MLASSLAGVAIVLIVHGLYCRLGELAALTLVNQALGLAIVLPLGLLIFLLVRTTGPNLSKERARRLALIIIGAATVLRIVWVLNFDSYQVSDFGVYARCGSLVGHSALPDLHTWIDQCRSAYSFDALPFWQRSLFYTAPIGWLLGISTHTIAAANILFITMTSLFAYLGFERLHSPRAALLAMPVFLSHPDLWYAATLASHDIPAMFWLALVIYAQSFLGDEQSLPWRRLGAAIIVGISICALRYQRDWDLPALLASAALSIPTIACVLSRKIAAQQRRAACLTLALQLLVPLSVYAVVRTGETHLLADVDRSQSVTLLDRVAATDTQSNGDWSAAYRWLHYYLPQLPPDVRASFATKKLINEYFSHPLQTLRHWLAKNDILSAPDGYLAFATMDVPVDNEPPLDFFATRVTTRNIEAIDAQRAALRWWTLLVLALVLWRLTLVTVRPFSSPMAFALLFSAILYGYLLLLAEVQPRYAIFLAFVSALAAGEALTLGKPKRLHLGVSALRLLGGALATLGLLLVVLTIGHLFDTISGYSLRDLSHFTVVHGDTQTIASTSTAREVVVALPPAQADVLTIAANALPCAHCQRLSFFLSDETLPLLQGQRPSTPVTTAAPHFRLRINGMTRMEGAVTGVTFHTFDLGNSQPVPRPASAIALTLEISGDSYVNERTVALRYVDLD